MLVADGLDASDFPRVANFLEAQVKGKAGEGGTLGCTVAALTKAGERLAVRLVVSERRCASSGIRLFTATLRHSSMALKNRYAQLLAEKERWNGKSARPHRHAAMRTICAAAARLPISATAPSVRCRIRK